MCHVALSLTHFLYTTDAAAFACIAKDPTAEVHKTAEHFSFDISRMRKSAMSHRAIGQDLHRIPSR